MNFVCLFKESDISFVDLFYSLCLYFIYFCSDLYDFFPFTNFGNLFVLLSLVALGERFGCLRFLCPEVRLHCCNFLLRTAFAASHRFWIIMLLFSFVSRDFFVISSSISSVIHWLFSSILFSLLVFVLVFFTVFFL